MEYEHSSAVFFSLGAKGKRAEQVGDDTADQLIAHHRTKAPLDPYLGDQILLPLSLADGPSQLQLSRITLHLRTNAAVIAKFLPVEIDILGEVGQPGEVKITPRQ
jgi:RNA 3'-terminal phosphate cyclase (ATP)